MAYVPSLFQAQDDDIDYYVNSYTHDYVFLIPCEMCGKIIKKSRYSHSRTYLCDYCKGVIKKKKKVVEELKDQGVLEVKTKKETSFDRAVELLKEQVADIKDYNKAIETAKTRVERYGSIPEILVAIELLKNHYKIIPQQKIGNKIADFVIPKEKLVIEVDGKIFHNNSEKEAKKDLYYNEQLGFDWIVIHVPADEIRKDVTYLKEFIDESVRRARSPYIDIYR